MDADDYCKDRYGTGPCSVGACSVPNRQNRCRVVQRTAAVAGV